MHNLSLPLSTNSGFLRYFENIAEANEMIAHRPNDPLRKHFFRDYDDFAGKNISGINMLVIPGTARYTPATENIHRIFSYEMHILKAAEATPDAIDAAIDICTTVHDLILATLAYDSNPSRLIERAFTYFRWEDVKTEIIDTPLFMDGMVGICSIIPMGSPSESFYFNPS